jgi:hypothetical protein
MAGKETYEALKALLEEVQDDVEKFYDKEVNAAGGRLRKFWKSVGDIGKEEKKNILVVRESRKTK